MATAGYGHGGVAIEDLAERTRARAFIERVLVRLFRANQNVVRVEDYGGVDGFDLYIFLRDWTVDEMSTVNDALADLFIPFIERFPDVDLDTHVSGEHEGQREAAIREGGDILYEAT